ncbi:hypothetical protein HYALB_00002655 [Hymenoscyphus albidus]|uniref:Cytochrome P450 n=1 Tax=Hymenoscyphus albidus TaxID=595503 RepID=A0A9N9LYM6_9HELO|nr:hypothetical protein HYALB_00002655 [Hymenoscyphus albidus]
MATLISTKDHAARKRMMAPMYSKSNIQNSHSVASILDKVVLNTLGNEVEHWAKTETTIDVHSKFRACATDITSAWVYGIDRGTDWLHDESDAKFFIENFNQSGAGFFWRSEFYGLVKVLAKIGLRLVPKLSDGSHRKLQEWSQKKCNMLEVSMKEKESDDSKARTNKRSTGTHLYGELRSALKETTQENTILRDETFDHILANQAGTEIALTYTAYSLSLHPQWQDRLRKEFMENPVDLDEDFLVEVIVRSEAIYSSKGTGHIASSTSVPSHFLSPRALDKLPIIDAILTETLRLYAPEPGPWPRSHPSATTTLGKYTGIPPGTIISASAFSLHRNKEVFPDPEEWRPERWLEATPEKRAEMWKWFWAFGSGTRPQFRFCNFLMSTLFVERCTIGYDNLALEAGRYTRSRKAIYILSGTRVFSGNYVYVGWGMNFRKVDALYGALSQINYI